MSNEEEKEDIHTDPYEDYDNLDEFESEDEELKELKEVQPNKNKVYDSVIDKSGGKNYLSNKELLAEVIKCKEVSKISDRLARMLMLLAERYSRRSNFIGYSYREDMVSEALLNLCKNALKFNPEKSNNPFAYYTRAIHCSFLQYMASEKREHYIRDIMLVEEGEDPSHNFENSIVKRRLDERETKKKTKKKQQEEHNDSYFDYE